MLLYIIFNIFLQDIKNVAIQINSARTDRIKLLNSLIFKNYLENRKESRLFTGFNFKDGDDQFQTILTKF